MPKTGVCDQNDNATHESLPLFKVDCQNHVIRHTKEEH